MLPMARMSEDKGVTLYVDGRPYPAEPGRNVLQACLTAGLDLPYFCWHPALGSVGACRQCAVKTFKDADDTEGRIVMACMTPVEDGLRVSITDPEARAFRASVIEWLMANHPHDCPVCDEGGECHLQDMTVMSGHAVRQYPFPKRTHRNQDLGPFLHHEMNRCITCYRCVRFYADYAGGRDLEAFASKDHVYFGRAGDGPLENAFSGNLVEVCPTGVFTDRPFKNHYTRKWDLQTTPSVCGHCGVGCNTLLGARYDRVRRTLNRYNPAVNGHFLCDRGRFGHLFLDAPQRSTQAWADTGTGRERLDGPAAVRRLGRMLADATGIVGIGSPRASVESNFAVRALVGRERYSNGLAAGEHRLLARAREALDYGPVATPTLAEIEAADAVFVLGEDLHHTAPRIALAVRQAARNAAFRQADATGVPRWQDHSVRTLGAATETPLFVATATATDLDRVASRCYRAPPAALARLGDAVAHRLDPAAPAADETDDNLAGEVAEALRTAERPLVITGTHPGSEALLNAAANCAWAAGRENPQARLYIAVPECNSLGTALIDGAPVEQVLETVERGEADTIVVCENDLGRRTDPERVHRAFKAARQVIVLDHLDHATLRGADLALPAAPYPEASGTWVTAEGRAQRHFRAAAYTDDARESWRWLAEAAGDHLPIPAGANLDDLVQACAGAVPALARIGDAAPGADFRVLHQKVPRQPPHYTGRTAEHAGVALHEPAPPPDPDSPLGFTMEGPERGVPAALTPRYRGPGWNSVQALNRFANDRRDGDPDGAAGVRLLEANPAAQPGYHPPVAGETSAWQLVPLYRVFGSEELSAVAAPIRERTGAAVAFLHPEALAAIGAGEGEPVVITVDGVRRRLPAHADPVLARDTVAVTVDLAGPGPVAGAATVQVEREQAP